ncbi:hypothetical protein Sste5346_005675 [Sporothrix stenoceras]|uniref:Uncharacterized protein n=1 Tax=Sporothrix stenoceras TaxID=5173 RepID=A0ABR3Z3D7_9PEZI
MSVSPSSSPRRMLHPQQQKQQQHASPLATQHTNDDDTDTYDYYNGYASQVAPAAPTSPTKDRGRGGDRGDFYQISLNDGPGAPAQKAQTPASPRPAVDHLRSPSSVSVSSSSYQPYAAQTQTQPQHSRAQSYSQGYNRNDNYGYRPNYASPSASPSAAHTRKLSTGNLRPVQEYHNAFANGDTAYAAPSPSISAASPTLPRAPSTSASPQHSPTPSTSSSHFATLSSASRAFLEHRRQQSIPNLLPSIQSIGRNLGRAISPDRSLRSFQQSSRPPIPQYKDNRGSDDDDSESSEEYSESEDGDDYGSEDDKDGSRRNSGNMGFTGDARPSRRGDNSYTTFKGNSNSNNATPSKGLTESPSVAAGFSNWLSGGSKATSPDRAAFLSSSRTTTPEPTNLVLRGGPASGASPTARRAMSVASDMSATPRSSVTVGATTTSASRFSQLATSMTATLNRLTQQQSPVSPRTLGATFENDEFYNMDLDAALFPAGQPSERDAFSPSAFKNLETNALGALRRIQAAYRQRAVAHHDLAAEKSVRDEELEEAETRAQHLKMQLEGMARRAADQQKEMQILMDELAAEKKARAQERAMLLQGMPTTATASTAPTILSEDLGVDEAQRDQKRRNASWRRRSLKSNGSSYDGNNYTDDGDENDEEAEISSALDEDERSNGSSSVFSRSRSPTFTPSINLNLDHATDQPQVAHPRVAALGSGAGGSMRLPSTGNRSVSSASTGTVVSSTFQKLMKNVTAAIKDEEPFSDRLSGSSSSCRNCRGEDVSFAWNTVSVLRDENKHLKQRVGQLELAVEGALDMVNGVGL